MRRRIAFAVLALATAGGILVASRIPEERGGDGGRPPPVELLAQNLVVFEGRDAALRIAFEPADPSARVIARLDPATARVTLCPLGSLDEPLPPPQECRDASSGVREDVAGEGLRAVAIVLAGAERATADVRLEFAERGRDVSIAIPRLASPPGLDDCADEGCDTFVEMAPARTGPFRARARWTGNGAELLFLQGRVVARSFTATGLPYKIAGRATGRGPLTVEAHTSAGDEYALFLRSAARSTELRAVRIDASWT